MLGCVKESEGPRVAGKTEENLEKMREGGGGGGGKGGGGKEEGLMAIERWRDLLIAAVNAGR